VRRKRIGSLTVILVYLEFLLQISNGVYTENTISVYQRGSRILLA